MKIVHCFNMANDGWSIVKGLRAIGADAHLIVKWPDHVTSFPQWEECDLDMTKLGDMYNPDRTVLEESWPLPEYVHVWNNRRKSYPLSRTVAQMRSIMMLGEYDVVVGHFPFARLALAFKITVRKPYLIYDAGWIRTLYVHNSLSVRLARHGYRYADKILFTNLDAYHIFPEHGYPTEQLAYTPFAIDTDLYSPQAVGNRYDRSPLFFAPARHFWSFKGNDLLIYAFGKYLKRQPNALLLLVEWGQVSPLDKRNDVFRSKQLIEDLNIEKSVKWIPVVPKRELVRYYNMADAVFEEFLAGGSGTAALESMSCGKPTVIYLDPSLWLRWHGSIPPVVSPRTVDEIYQAMVDLEDSSFRSRIGHDARQWIMENCEMKLVAKHQLEVCEQIADQ